MGEHLLLSNCQWVSESLLWVLSGLTSSSTGFTTSHSPSILCVSWFKHICIDSGTQTGLNQLFSSICSPDVLKRSFSNFGLQRILNIQLSRPIRLLTSNELILKIKMYPENEENITAAMSRFLCNIYICFCTYFAS